MELYSYIGLNEAIFQWTIESGQLSRDQQEFLVECLEKSSRFSIPLKITRRREKGKHAGQITGYYNITAYIPLPEHEITDEPYKKMTCFVKLMNDKNAHEREGFHHAKYHNLGNPSPKLLYTHAFKDTQIFIYQFADDKKIMELFGPEIESYIGKQK